MAVKFSNNATSTLAAPIDNAATTVTIQAGDAAKFPTLTGGHWCPLTLVDGAGNLEIVKATARAGAVFTVVRGQEATAAQAFAAGTRIDLRLTAAALLAVTPDPPGEATPSAAGLMSAADKAKLDGIGVGSGAPGQVAHFALASAPSGWLKANGAAVSRTTYAALWAAMGSPNTGDGATTFTLPDLRGEFIRGLDDGRGVDVGRPLGSAQGDQNKSHTHTGSAASAGDHSHSGTTGTESADHTHNTAQGIVYVSSGQWLYPNQPGSGSTIGYNVSTGGRSAAHTHSFSTSTGGAHTHTLTINADGGTEARPRNVALLACIKY